MSFSSLLFGAGRNEQTDLFIKNRAPIRRIPSHLQAYLKQHVTGNHVYIEMGQGDPVVFCHGLFGGIFNIDKVAHEIAKGHRFIMPYLPMYDMSLKDCTVQNLGEYIESFVADIQLKNPVLIGSSMGGGAALHVAYKKPSHIKALVLCGSSGLSSIPLSKGFFKRKNFDFVQESTRDIFYNRSIPPHEMVLDVFDAIQHYEIVLRSIRFTKAATNQQMHQLLPSITTPALLVWGRQDPITVVDIAPKFAELLPNAELVIVEECGHVPTQEKPAEFMEHFYRFMQKLNP